MGSHYSLKVILAMTQRPSIRLHLLRVLLLPNSTIACEPSLDHKFLWGTFIQNIVRWVLIRMETWKGNKDIQLYIFKSFITFNLIYIWKSIVGWCFGKNDTFYPVKLGELRCAGSSFAPPHSQIQSPSPFALFCVSGMLHHQWCFPPDTQFCLVNGWC